MKFSIIVPVYNVERYLPECLDSILRQGFSDFEVICIDDGSTDGSPGTLEMYAHRDPRIRVIHKANAGVGAARNTALSYTSGDYVLFVDSDDVIDSDWLRDIHAVIDRFDPDIVRVGFENWYGGAVPKVRHGSEIECRLIEGAALRDEWWKAIVKDGCMAWRLVIRRERLGVVRFGVRIKIFEDILFAYSIIFNASRVVLTNADGYFYRKDREGTLTSRARTAEEGSDWIDALLSAWLCRDVERTEASAVIAQYFLFYGLKHWWRGCVRRPTVDFGRLRNCLRMTRKEGLLDYGRFGTFHPFVPLGIVFSLAWHGFMRTGSPRFLAVYDWYYWCVAGIKRLWRK